MAVKFIDCALGNAYLALRGGHYFLVINDINEVWCSHDDHLPGGKFTARGLVEKYLEIWKAFPQPVNGPQRFRKSRPNLGTFYFTPEAVELAKTALEEWSK